MRTWNTVEAWLGRRRGIDGRSIGFVPTMGVLHRGHAALVERCRVENEIAVVSIFVNPSQFNDPRDLERYPRTLEQDLALLERLGVDDVIVPSSSALYPHGYRMRVEPVADDPVMEAAYRPGFLQGVLTVVLKLFGIVRPGRAYFGEKDYQQLLAVKGMVQEFFLETQIIPCATVRAESGLAESSRNTLLSPEARVKAAWLYRALTAADTPARAREMLAAQGLAVEYVEERWERRFAAVYLEGVRLIDNVGVAEITRLEPMESRKHAPCTGCR